MQYYFKFIAHKIDLRQGICGKAGFINYILGIYPIFSENLVVSNILKLFYFEDTVFSRIIWRSVMQEKLNLCPTLTKISYIIEIVLLCFDQQLLTYIGRIFILHNLRTLEARMLLHILGHNRYMKAVYSTILRKSLNLFCTFLLLYI
ncbi:Hypothetical_protein [Hexamita inflata]|uniref:Hypothetical_protein n=1 Tax=Hexamita inflata TaxID=28002 RepID=A0AA86PGW8_9EUKA|nr:Hypothetical protein HINF_LOCUS25705 [Hexamita inflata]CAI9938061.1 Hypothetical protein HINF_LOCUS25706 [Hexamita inflata]CAI9938062.1 Hypothetical protein HINF_LOCUS25707 [Hexamita inflata]CAI9938063.1 Hypothetical protein HINF_LOCUS25708 [Hexamita inflata]CAI9938064.1 Hypothetical protein HINF_LOCUS25709 [Hexamita inflata]